ncbi:MAG: tripartite tricarboxylate transporter substrate binding protein [Burkholderiaceae bacterium]|nr:tripartite tricarboxylate transporter substrate binding protein [Burkholderiaceae bacterium]
MKRRTLILSAAGALGTFAAATSRAQPFPRKPVRIIVPFPAGGSNDLIARAISDKLAARLGQPVVVEDKPGASGSIGTDMVAKSDADGHTLLLASLPTAVAPALMKTPWDPVKDLTGVAYLGVTPNIVAVHPSLGVNNLRELVDLAKARNGELNYVNSGNGTSPHLGAEVFQYVNGVKLTPIMYKGAPPSVTDFVAGTVPVGFYPFGVIIGLVKSGRAKAIALAGPVRSRQLPDVPTMTEQGFESSLVNSWFALMAPAGTPAAVVQQINTETNAVLADPATVAAMETLGGAAVPPWTPQQTTDMIVNDTRRWADLIPKAGIKG